MAIERDVMDWPKLHLRKGDARLRVWKLKPVPDHSHGAAPRCRDWAGKLCACEGMMALKDAGALVGQRTLHAKFKVTVARFGAWLSRYVATDPCSG